MAVKNAKMFKERLKEVLDKKMNTINNHQLGKERSEGRDVISGILIVNMLKNKILQEKLEEELIGFKHSYFDIGRFFENNFPLESKKIEKQLKLSNKSAKQFKKNNDKRLTNFYEQLSDRVLFNGKDPLEAINELQNFKIQE